MIFLLSRDVSYEYRIHSILVRTGTIMYVIGFDKCPGACISYVHVGDGVGRVGAGFFTTVQDLLQTAKRYPALPYITPNPDSTIIIYEPDTYDTIL